MTITHPASTARPSSPDQSDAVEHVDVLIVGAGISGIGSAVYLREKHPDRTFVLLDALDGYGGTWWTHRYPGIRSDSDLHTFGYSFKPWIGPTIAPAKDILDYLGDTIAEHGLEPALRLRHRVEEAAWSSEDGVWTVRAVRGDTGETVKFTAAFLWMNQGYYDHDGGFTPEWPGLEDFSGTVVHPQHWPEDLDATGKRVVVIGSGATAATLVPALASQAAHVTMLQRSPTYFLSRPYTHELAQSLIDLDVQSDWRHEIMRRRHLADFIELNELAANDSDTARALLIEDVRRQLPEEYDVERHFAPSYRPLQQRLAFLPNGDLFTAIREGAATVVTDTIDTFDETGIRLSSGEHLDADIVVTSTGLVISLFGGIEFVVDGEPVDVSKQVTYHGLMITGLPNFAYTFGYFRWSWTLRVDLVGEFVTRLLTHLDEKGATSVVPRLRPEDADMPLLPWIDPDNVNPGYLMRSQEVMYRRGDREPWIHFKEYTDELISIPAIDLDESALNYR